MSAGAQQQNVEVCAQATAAHGWQQWRISICDLNLESVKNVKNVRALWLERA